MISPMISLEPQPLTQANFADFGRVIEAGETAKNQMNSGTFARFDDLAFVDYAEAEQGEIAKPAISIVRSQTPTPLPHQFDLVECHPLCSQAFVPLANFCFYVVVAAKAPQIDAGDLRAFVTNGNQGISYYPGTWHLPLIAQSTDQQFLVVDQASRLGNLREHKFSHKITLNPHST